ncbi:energy-coupling factor ABC transporter ATP-binding protein [Paracoccus sp. IB05]|uniref:energy-coupling factor ABC transporter ATP-binding protein n=1 Tax=Paracoccus sp. IB05 TaxID=2779367 RepID=UPI0018E855B2|nr:ABC transporter ATP-binding protein [Paracoccus sp. IB05]MBJ2152971.1 ABC transporter ATP-binding protein [Paracoccus sp. IB05]
MTLRTDLPPPLIIRTGAVRVPGGRSILAALHLDLSEPRIAIIGRNGSGKTSFMRLLAGLIAAESGSVSLGGEDMFKNRRAALSAIGILFQNPDHQILFPTVAEELAFGLTQQGINRREARMRVDALLASEARSHWAEASVSTLSGGQKQYLCLMALLLMAPQTLLLDEPFSGLDMPTALRLKRRLAALPMRIITIGHDPRDLKEQNRVLWFEGGAIRMDGPPDQVLPAFETEMSRLGEVDADTDLAG